MPRDGARVRSFSKKADSEWSTIKCVRHRGRRRRATNQSHDRTTLIPGRWKLSNLSVNRLSIGGAAPLKSYHRRSRRPAPTLMKD